MPLTLSPVLLSDLPSVHHLSLTADAQYATSRVLFPNAASKTTIAHLVAQDEKSMQDPRSTARHVLVRDVPTKAIAEEAKGEVVSYAMWNFFVGRTEGEGTEAYYDEWPEDVNQEAVKQLFERGKKKREEVMGERDYCRRYHSSHSAFLPVVSHRCRTGLRGMKWPETLFSKHAYSVLHPKLSLV